MSVKIRLARHGRKGYAYYHIVVADSRAPRDGRFIERIGSYNPNTDPATIDLNFDKALDWLQKGAQPTNTCRLILSYRGVLLKKHLLEGVKKGAFDEQEAEARFQKWLNEKQAKVDAKIDRLDKEKKDADKEKMEAELKVKEERAQELARKYAAEAEAEKAEAEAAEAAEAGEEEVVAEDAGEETVVEETATEEPASEEPVAEEEAKKDEE
ncbi:MAG: 30S ribosomal protein S16 [Bacteroidales bacterium]|nr:30S ribosomal protein S16 [Bacteroidales bacterium]